MKTIILILTSLCYGGLVFCWFKYLKALKKKSDLDEKIWQNGVKRYWDLRKGKEAK